MVSLFNYMTIGMIGLALAGVMSTPVVEADAATVVVVDEYANPHDSALADTGEATPEITRQGETSSCPCPDAGTGCGGCTPTPAESTSLPNADLTLVPPHAFGASPAFDASTPTRPPG